MRAFILTFATLFGVACSYSGESAKSMVEVREKGSTAHKCLKQNIPGKLLGELYTTVQHIKNSLPKDDIRYNKLLPRFTRSLKKTRGISVIKELLDFYYNDVFSNESVNVRSQEKMLTYLSRMRDEVNYCLKLHPGSLSSEERNKIHNMKETFNRLKIKGVYKSIEEFKTVLVWIDTYMHQKKQRAGSRRKRQ